MVERCMFSYIITAQSSRRMAGGDGLLVCIAFGGAGLWVTHLVAFAGKAVTGKTSHRPSQTNIRRPTISRRDTAGLFLRAVVIGTLISVVPRAALAQSLVLASCADQGCGSCSKPGYMNGKFIGCVSCHSCGSGCWDSPGSALPNGC
jgi:hypothetical protein